ncbi:MAG: 1-acyl-sn-glycerol-3-phosphate acyltransferase [Deltaproteobacteria bacterium]|nr:1-acyl-sn-glycerol-3-phosphate acyltransferase [Deltaproteobacteria bacterium]
MRLVRRHRIVGLEEARATYRRALEARRPTLVCANHLTMVDSAFLHHAFASVADYLTDFRRFSWNVPAVENFTTNAALRAIVYLGKCIPIDRSGDAAHHKQVLDTIKELVSHGEVVTLFPEGGRSRTGRVEPANVTYGVGQILRDLGQGSGGSPDVARGSGQSPDGRPQVLCAYLRGERQDTWSNMPERGDTMHLRVELLEPVTQERGLRASRDLAQQVIAKLKAMEDAFFAARARS